jgi:hypothetical protein
MNVQQDIDKCEDVEGGIRTVVIRSMVNRRNPHPCNSHEESINNEVFLPPLDTGDPYQPTTRCANQEECAKGRCRGVEL